jgi:hypothetical protein
MNRISILFSQILSLLIDRVTIIYNGDYRHPIDSKTFLYLIIQRFLYTTELIDTATVV